MNTQKKYKYNDLQRAWLEDLKTTTEKQGRRWLCLEDDEGIRRYCCLGRACVVAGIAEIKYGHIVHFKNNRVQMGAALDIGLQQQLKLRSKLGDIRTDDGELDYYTLTDMNDSGDWTFKQIADWIEQNPDKVFSDYEEQMMAPAEIEEHTDAPTV